MSETSPRRSNGDESILDMSAENSDDNVEAYDAHELLEKSGGFGKFQWLLLLYILTVNSGVNFFVGNLAFLELVPDLKCKYDKDSDFITCHDKKDICDHNKVFDWYPNFNDKESFHNWMTEQNLYCKSSFMIGLFGSLYYVGYALIGIIVKQSDRFGRKPILIFGNFSQVIICYTLYFANNYIVYYVGIFLAGLVSSTNIMIYIYATESVPRRSQILVGGYALIVQSLLPLTLSPAYFYFGGKNWKIPLMPPLVFCVLGFIGSLFIPESPRYLYAKKDWRNLRRVMKIISKINGAKMNQYYFIDEGITENSRDSKAQLRTAIEQHETVSSLDIGKQKKEEFSVLSALKDPKVLINFVICVSCFSFLSFNYHLIDFFIKYVGGNIFINTFLGNISQTLGNIIAGSIHK